MFEQLTDATRKIMALANQEAQRWNHECIEAFHLLAGLVKDKDSDVAKMLKRKFKVGSREVRLGVEQLVKPGPENKVTRGKLPQTPSAKKAIAGAIEAARKGLPKDTPGKDVEVAPEYLLLGLLSLREDTVTQLFVDLKIDRTEAVEETERLLSTVTEQFIDAIDKAVDGGRLTFNGQKILIAPVLCERIVACRNNFPLSLVVDDETIVMSVIDDINAELGQSLPEDIVARISKRRNV